MAYFYADSSVLVKFHVIEPGSAWVQTTFAMAESVVATVSISMVEVASAFNSRVREGSLVRATYDAIIADFEALCATAYDLIDTTSPLLQRARLLLDRHPLRAYDAIQLSSALLVNESLVAAALDPLTFLSADDRLLSAAQAEGLASLNPIFLEDNQ